MDARLDFYDAGAAGARTAFANVLLPLLVTAVITLISDLDRPHRGRIGISQQPLRNLKASISAPSR